MFRRIYCIVILTVKNCELSSFVIFKIFLANEAEISSSIEQQTVF
jgi:hypothetical protein